MLKKITDAIDTFTRKQGEYSSLLIIPMLVVVLYEVFMRYVINQPTIWGFEATTFLYGVHYMLGYSYTDVLDGHVKVDIFTSQLSKKVQNILGLLTTCLFFLPVIGCMTIWSIKYAITSVSGLERNPTSWAPPVWPFKIIMALAFLFLLVQGISNLLKYIRALSENNHASEKR